MWVIHLPGLPLAKLLISVALLQRIIGMPTVSMNHDFHELLSARHLP
jgi:hypothetical protein